MDAAAEAELRELRARAYGPHADIATDPAALRRLQELESSRVAASTRRRGGSTTAGGGPGAARDSGDRRDPGEITELRVVLPAADESRASDDLIERLDDDSFWDDPDADDEESEETDWRARLVRWRTPLWVASVVASAALAGTMAFALASIAPVSSSAGAPQIDTLTLSSAGVIPPGWFGAEKDAVSADFYGLTVFVTPLWSSESGDRSAEDRCINVVSTDQLPEWRDYNESSWGFEGQMYSDCGMGVFPATAEVPLGGFAPDELRERYPSGTTLQFVLDGDSVGVFLDSSEE